MKRMSFSATIGQMRDGSKTVTRRDPGTWKQIQPGDRLLAIEKATGLKPGEKQVRIGVIQITDIRVERLGLISEPGEAQREGFAHWSMFAAAWTAMHGTFEPDAMVRRIEFAHIHPAEPASDPIAELIARLTDQMNTAKENAATYPPRGESGAFLRGEAAGLASAIEAIRTMKDISTVGVTR